MSFFYYNANPKGIRTGDCVVRAFSYFLGMSWAEALQSLIDWGIKNGLVLFHYRGFYNKYLLERGYKKRKTPNQVLTVRDFCDKYAEDGGLYLIQCPRHVTIVHNKGIVDTWDCGHLKVEGYWDKADAQKNSSDNSPYGYGGRCWDDGNF